MSVRDLETRLRELLNAATPGPWFSFHIDDDHAMNCYGITTDPDFQTTENFLTGSDSPEAACRRIVALTLYQAKRVVCHEAGRWGEDADLVVAAVNALPELLSELARLRERETEAVKLARAAHIAANEGVEHTVGYTACQACADAREANDEWWINSPEGHDEDCPIRPFGDLLEAVAAFMGEEWIV